MISNIYAQCDDYNLNQCNNDNSCEWVEDIETGNCGNLWGDDCELNPECNWNCDSVDDYMGWCTYSCDGGSYEIDNSYCQEIEMPECNEENEFQCTDGLCIPIHRVCNNFNDCLDGSDEIDCEDCSELLESDSWVGKAGAYDLAGAMGSHARLIAGTKDCVLGLAPTIITNLIEQNLGGS